MGSLRTTRLDALLDRLGLAERRRHRPDALSGGEQQRVAIARAMIGEPSIILADEPTGSLDSVTGQSICRLLQELCQEQGRTIVVVTHEPAVAVWAERIVVLKDGRCLTEFPTAQFRDAHSLAAHYQDIVNADVAGAPRAVRRKAAGTHMKITWKLALAYAWHHPTRMLLTSLAMIASACVVVWVVSGYDAMVSQFGDRATEYPGTLRSILVPDNVEESFISPELIEAIRKDPAIAELEPVLQATVRVQTDRPLRWAWDRGASGGGRATGEAGSPRPLGEGPRVGSAPDAAP